MKFWLQILKKSKSIGILFALTILISLAGLLSPIFIIHIFNRFIAFGLQGTLIFLVTGALLVAVFEYFFRNLRNKILDQNLALPIKALKFELTQKYFVLESGTKVRFLPVRPNIQSLTSSTERFIGQSQERHTWSVIMSSEAQKTLVKIPPTQVEKLKLWIQRIEQEGLIKTQQYPGYRDHTLHNRGHEKWAGHRSVSLNKENTRVIYKILPATEGTNRKIKVIKILTQHNY